MPPDPDELGMDPTMAERIGDVLSNVDASDSLLVEPPADLWERIATSIETTPDQAPRQSETAPVASPPEVVVLADRRRPRWLVPAAAAVVVAAIVGGILVARDGSSPRSTLVASATVAPLEGHASARAKLIRTDGHLRLQLIVRQMPAAPAGQYYELWLMDRAITVPVSLGPMTGSTTVTIPTGVDTTRFPVVDISLQPKGHPEYSGHSVLRGTLA